MTILETTPIMASPHTYMWIMIVSIIGIILSIVVMKKENFYDSIATTIATISICIFFILFVIGIFLDACEPKIDTGRLQYTVRLDNTVSVNEFYEKYKVIEHTKYTDVYVVEEIIND